MFDSLNINKTPNNLCKAFVSDCDQRFYTYKRPYEEYNDIGELVGYSWHYGDPVALEFITEGELTLESNAIVLTAKGASPQSDTKGEVGQKAYNTTDLISWTCTSSNVLENIYEWTQDEEFILPQLGINTYVTVKDYLEGKYFQINIYNFRYEKEYSSLPIPAKEIINFNIDNNIIKETSCNDNSSNMSTEIQYKPLSRGVHYLTLVLTDENGNYIDTLIGQQECSLIIK